MNFNLTEEQIMIRDAARDFAQRELLPDVLERDRDGIFPEKQVKMLTVTAARTPEGQKLHSSACLP